VSFYEQREVLIKGKSYGKNERQNAGQDSATSDSLSPLRSKKGCPEKNRSVIFNP
jgi:hypothetical protein